VTVYRSPKPTAHKDAAAILDLLAGHGISGELAEEATPPVSASEWTVRVAAKDAAQAEKVIAANPPAKEDPAYDPAKAEEAPELDGPGSEKRPLA
jgi:hypothetical protein